MIQSLGMELVSPLVALVLLGPAGAIDPLGDDAETPAATNPAEAVEPERPQPELDRTEAAHESPEPGSLEPEAVEPTPSAAPPEFPTAPAPMPPPDVEDEQAAKQDAKQRKKKLDVDVQLRIITGFRVRATHPVPEQMRSPRTTAKFQLRQARVKVKAHYEDILRARASIDLADFLDPVDGNDVLRDAWANVRIHQAVQFKLGHFKRPYSRLELRGVNEIPFIGRGLYNGFAVEDLGWGDRALGAAVWGKVKPKRPGLQRAEWSVSASNHAFDGAPDGVDVHARGSIDPLDWLSIAAGGAFKYVEDPLEAKRSVFGASGDVTAKWKGLYASVEVDAAQDWTYADFSPWVLGTLGYISYEWKVTRKTRLQPVLGAEFFDANLSLSRSEAVRFVAHFNVLWKKYLRVMPQVEIIRPVGTVTDVNPIISRETYGVWLSLQL